MVNEHIKRLLQKAVIEGPGSAEIQGDPDRGHGHEAEDVLGKKAADQQDHGQPGQDGDTQGAQGMGYHKEPHIADQLPNGAAEAGVKSCGALWGYGNKEEFMEHNADMMAEMPLDVLELV